mgnify:CR=1 FL=1
MILGEEYSPLDSELITLRAKARTIFEKYNKSVLDNLYKDNMLKILDFLKDEKCDYIEELIDDYLDLFMIDYEEFVVKCNVCMCVRYVGSIL